MKAYHVKKWISGAVAGAITLSILFWPMSGHTAFGKQEAANQNSGVQQTTVQTSAPKEEVVYANLSATGQVEQAYVVNSFDLKESSTVVDYGAYDSVENLTNLQPIEQAGEEITFTGEAGKFYYQGNLKDSTLPWDVKITYTLDGVEITPEELAGQSGYLVIHLVTTQNEQINPAFYENYLLQISVTLDTDLCEDIQAPDGTFANAGQDKMITFTVLPGSDGDMTVSAQVKDFEMTGISLSAVPYSMAFDLPDTSEMTGQMTTLSEAIGSLAEGAQQLKDGIGALSDGAKQLKGGSSEIRTGLDQLDTNGDSLVEASQAILDGLTGIQDALGQEGEMGSGDLEDLAALPDGLNQLADSLGTMADQISPLKDGFTLAHTALKNSIQSIPQAIPQEDLEKLVQENPDDPTIAALIETYEAAQGVKGVYSQVGMAFTTTQNALDGMVSGLETMEEGLRQSAEGFSAAISDMDIDQMITGLGQLAQNYGAFHQGLVEYTGGVSQLSEGYRSLDGGIAELADGLDQTEQGMGEYTDGMGQLNDQTKDLPDAMQQAIDELMDSYDFSDYVPVSFTSQQNTNVSLVQFVLQTQGIEKQEQPVVAEETEEENFWTRILDLFR